MPELQDMDPAAQERAVYALAESALASWDGEFSDLSLIKYRENAVFSVVRNGTTRFALRVHRLDYHTDASLRSELQWVRYLASAGIGVPEIIPAASGDEFALATAPGLSRPRQADMLGWLEGGPIGSVEEGLNGTAEEQAALYFEVGALAARLHQHTSVWTLPQQFSRHAWDHDGFIGAEPFWGRFWELDGISPEHLATIQRAVEQCRAELLAYGITKDNYGLIHADFVPENIIQADGKLFLIDFDDCGFGWHMFELATALYFHLEAENYKQIRRAMIEGYRSVRTLDDRDLKMIEVFLFLRSTTYLGWVHTRSETETARELKPFFIDTTVRLAQALG